MTVLSPVLRPFASFRPSRRAARALRILAAGLFFCALGVSAYAQEDAFTYQPDTPPSDALLQGFYWNVHPGDTSSDETGVWWDSLRTQAPLLAAQGYSTVWIPSPFKGFGGRFSMGYDLYDFYDLGRHNQQGSTRTRFGSEQQFFRMMDGLKGAGLRVMVDAVLNHRFGGDEQSEVACVPGGGAPFEQFNVFRPRSRRFPSDSTHFHSNATHCDFAEPYHSDIFGVDFCYFERTDPILDPAAPGGGWHHGPHNLGAVGDSLVVWGRYLTQTLGFDELRVDAVKHIEPGFLAPWLVEIAEEQPYVVGEHFSGSDEIAAYQRQVTGFNVGGGGAGSRQARMAVFDFDLRATLKDLADGGGFFDMQRLNDAGLLGRGLSGFDVTTFLENHDKDRRGFVGADCSAPGALRYGASCFVLDTDSGHNPVVSRKHLGYAYMMAAEGRPTVFWKDVFWYGLGDELAMLMALRAETGVGTSTPMARLDPFYLGGSSASDLFVLRRNGSGGVEDGALLAINDSDGGAQEAYVNTPFTNVHLKDYSDAALFQTTRVFADTRALVRAEAGDYAWYAPTGLYPQPPGEVRTAFEVEAVPGGVVHYVVLRASGAANLQVDGRPLAAGDAVAVLGKSGAFDAATARVAGIARVGQALVWDGVHDLVIEVIGNDGGDVLGTGRLDAGDALRLVVQDGQTGRVMEATGVQFAPGGTALQFSARRPRSRGGAAPFPLTTSAGSTFAVDGISLVTAFETASGASRASARVFLGGALRLDAGGGPVMPPNLRALLPDAQPYDAAPWNYDGGETLPAPRPTTATDWVLLEVRRTPEGAPVARRAVLLHNDGTIRGTDGNADLFFADLEPGGYYLTLHHRNHAPATSAAPVQLSARPPVFDFSDPAAAPGALYDPTETGAFALIPADGDQSERVTARDQAFWLAQRTRDLGYYAADYDLDGRVNARDEAVWLAARGATRPGLGAAVPGGGIVDATLTGVTGPAGSSVSLGLSSVSDALWSLTSFTLTARYDPAAYRFQLEDPGADFGAVSGVLIRPEDACVLSADVYAGGGTLVFDLAYDRSEATCTGTEGYGDAVFTVAVEPLDGAAGTRVDFAGGDADVLLSAGGADLLGSLTGFAGLMPVSTAAPAEAALLTLGAPYPNPTSGLVAIPFTLPDAQHARIEVFDALGRRVALLHDGVLPPGAHTTRLDAAQLSAGTYAARLRTGGALRHVTFVIQ